MSNDYKEVDISVLFKKTIKLWWLYALIIISCVVGANYYTENYITPIYETNATLFIGKEISDEKASIAEVVRQGTSLVEDYKLLVRTDVVLTKVVSDLGLEMSTENISSRLGVMNVVGSRFIYLSYSDSNPDRAVAVINRVAEVLKIKAEEVVNVKNVYIVDYAKIPKYPISPSVSRNRMAGAMFGFIVSILLSLFIALRKTTVETEKDIERITGAPIIGVIPKFKGE